MEFLEQSREESLKRNTWSYREITPEWNAQEQSGEGILERHSEDLKRRISEGTLMTLKVRGIPKKWLKEFHLGTPTEFLRENPEGVLRAIFRGILRGISSKTYGEILG